MCIALLASPQVVLYAETDLATVVSEDAMVYVGWSGRQHTRLAARDTAMGRILAESQVIAFTDGLWTQINGLLQRHAFAGQPALGAAVLNLIKRLYESPTALVIFDVQVTPMGPSIEAAIVCRAGDKAPKLVNELTKILSSTGMPPAQAIQMDGHEVHQLPLPAPGGLFCTTKGGNFILFTGTTTWAKLTGTMDGKTPPLSEHHDLKLARRKIGGQTGSRSFSVHVDVPAVLNSLDRLFLSHYRNTEESVLRSWTTNSGFGNVQSLTYETHHTAGGYLGGTFMQFNGSPPQGSAMDLYTGPRLDASDLQWIPRDVSWAYAGRFGSDKPIDALGLFSMVPPVTTFLDEIKAKTGVHLKHDLLDLIGDRVVAFDSPEDGGILFTGVCVVIKPTDIARMTESVRKLISALGANPSMLQANVKTSQYRGHAIEFVNTVGLPIPIAPSWTTHNEHLILALYPQVVRNEVDRMLADGRNTLQDNPDFQRGLATVGGQGSQVFYSDTRSGVAAFYPIALPIVQAGLAMGQQYGFDMTIDQFPALPVITRHLFGDVGTVRSDKDGVLMKTHGPLPLALPGGSSSSTGVAVIGVVAVAVSVLLPSLARARQAAKHTLHLSKLRNISTALAIHHQSTGSWPQSLDELVRESQLSAEMLTGPDCDGHDVCYVYRIPQDNAKARDIVAHLNPRVVPPSLMIPVLYSDGSVDGLDHDTFKQRIGSP
jgi:type II secretory pathway pseudopilin PulG